MSAKSDEDHGRGVGTVGITDLLHNNNTIGPKAPVLVPSRPGTKEYINKADAEAIVKIWVLEVTRYRERLELSSEEPIPNGARFTACMLADKSYSLSAVGVLSSFLLDESVDGGRSIASGVTHINLSNVSSGIGETATQEGPLILEAFCRIFADSALVSIVLTQNAIGVTNFDVCAPILSSTQAGSLRYLDISDSGLSNECLPALENLLTATNESGKNIAEGLAKFDISNNDLNPGDHVYSEEGYTSLLPLARIIAGFSDEITSINLNGTKQGRSGARAIVNALDALGDKVCNIRTLQADGITFQDCVNILGGAILRMPNLVDVKLSDCSLGDDGAETICASLNSKVSNLDLEGNDISTVGPNLLDFLDQSRTNLTKLNLDNNEIGSDGAEKIARVFKAKNCAIVTLSLNFCEIAGPGAIAFMQVFQMRKMRKLDKILVDGNHFSDADLSGLKQTFGISRLGDLDSNCLPEDEEQRDDSPTTRGPESSIATLRDELKAVQERLRGLQQSEDQLKSRAESRDVEMTMERRNLEEKHEAEMEQCLLELGRAEAKETLEFENACSNERKDIQEELSKIVRFRKLLEDKHQNLTRRFYVKLSILTDGISPSTGHATIWHASTTPSAGVVRPDTSRLTAGAHAQSLRSPAAIAHPGTTGTPLFPLGGRHQPYSEVASAPGSKRRRLFTSQNDDS